MKRISNQASQILTGQGRQDELSQWRGAFREALGPNGQLIVDLVPELALILGQQPQSQNLLNQESTSNYSKAD